MQIYSAPTHCDKIVTNCTYMYINNSITVHIIEFFTFGSPFRLYLEKE